MSKFTKTEPIVVHPTLPKLLQYKNLHMPLFQRAYSWGGPHKELSASSYFTDFLANKYAHTHLGNLFVYAGERYQFDQKKTDYIVWVGDGQHRLVTVVLGALVIWSALKKICLHSHPTTARKANDLLEDYESTFDAMEHCSMEVRTSPGSQPLRVVKFVRTHAEALESIEAEGDAVRAESVKNVDHIRATLGKGQRRSAKNSQTNDRNTKLAMLKSRAKALREVPLWKAYESLETALRGDNDPDFIDCLDRCQVFLERLEVYTLAMTCLMPKRDDVDLTSVDSEAFAMFAHMNGLAYPLTVGELLESNIQVRAAEGCRSRELTNDKSPSRLALTHFGLSTSEQLAEFGSRMVGKSHEPKPAYQWVTTELYASSSANGVLAELAGHVDQLVQFKTALDRASPELCNLYEMFFTLLRRPIYATYMSRIWKEIGPTPAESDLRTALKVLILLELSVLHVPKSNKRPNPHRDFDRLQTLKDGLAYVLRHFDIGTPTNGERPLDLLEAAFAHMLATCNIGAGPYRKHAKVVLVLSDFAKPIQGLVSNWQRYDYDHFFPSAFAKRSPELEAKDAAAYQVIVDEMRGMKPQEADALLQRLGNAALLIPSTNGSLSNKWPIEKVRLTVKRGLANSWWNMHWADISMKNGFFAPSDIKERSERLARNATRWLFSTDLQKLLP